MKYLLLFIPLFFTSCQKEETPELDCSIYLEAFNAMQLRVEVCDALAGVTTADFLSFAFKAYDVPTLQNETFRVSIDHDGTGPVTHRVSYKTINEGLPFYLSEIWPHDDGLYLTYETKCGDLVCMQAKLPEYLMEKINPNNPCYTGRFISSLTCVN